MKKILFVFACLCMSVSAFAEGNALILNLKDGTTHSFLLACKPKITFANDQVHFEGKGIAASFDFYEVADYTFNLTTGISQTEVAGSYRLVGNTLHVYGNADNKVQLYDVAGKPVNCKISGDAAHQEFNFSSLPIGTYIVKTNNTTFKISVK